MILHGLAKIDLLMMGWAIGSMLQLRFPILDFKHRMKIHALWAVVGILSAIGYVCFVLTGNA